MIAAIETPLHEDLTEFTAFLWRHGVAHRVVEEEGRQRLYVAPEFNPAQVSELYRYWRAGGDLSQVQLHVARGTRRSISWRRIPVTLSLILLSALFSLLIGFGSDPQRMALFSFTSFELSGQQARWQTLPAMLASGEWWRLITPIFMHFNLLHILFNLLWVWIVGVRVEPAQGSLPLLGLVLFAGGLSNLAQFLVSGPMFGGMSGVVFALLGYAWLWDWFRLRPRIGLPPALMNFMLFWLLLGFTGVLQGVGFGAIANTAHLVGLLAGLLWLWLLRLPGRRSG
ncbi:MAG: rhomboid family intramembrane serine protease [Pseudomonadota bacterium]|nr:rhomboid family intramembrane serine protease [Pseudomonadota bacterium]